MPRFNLYLILFAFLVYALTAGVSLRDRLLVATLHRIERDAYFEPAAQELFEGALSGMTDVLSDEHDDYYSMYIPPSRQARYQDNLADRYEGVGITLRTREIEDEKHVLIDYPLLESAGYRAGLRSGDQILEINGTSVAGQTSGEVARLIRLQGETEIRLSILPFGQTEPKEFVVHREKSYYADVVGNYYDSGNRVFHLETHPKIGYIWITSFNATTAKSFGEALESMMQSGVESFILDLRDNPGGDVWNCVLIARMLMLPDSELGNVIALVHDRNGRERFRHRNFVLTEGSQRCTLPMVVLINGETASSSEILAAALQDHRRATVVGSRSFGKGVIQGIVTLPFQSGMMQLTDSEYVRPRGAGIHRKKDATDSDDWGVVPDTIVELSESEQSAVIEYRTLRSNVIATERSAVLEQFRQQVIEEQSGEESGSEPFEFTGAAPYYDLQLDKAITILLDDAADSASPFSSCPNR